MSFSKNSDKGRPNPFLSGNWAPIRGTTPVDGLLTQVVKGKIPADLDGCFLRIGPNPSNPEEAANDKRYHFFSGDGLVVGVEFHSCQAIYRCQFVQTVKLKTGKDMFRNKAGEMERGGLANTAMVYHNEKLLCLEEGSKPYHVELPSLLTVGRETFNGQLQHNFTAHPKICSKTGELIFFGYDFGSRFIQYSVANPHGAILHSITIPFRKPVQAPTPHDMAITENYSIFLDFPLWSMNGSTKEKDEAWFGVLPRHARSSEEMKWFRTTGQMGYHVANSWEDSYGNIILIVVTAFEFNFTKSNKSTLFLRKWTLNMSQTFDDVGLATEIVKGDVVSDISCEFPIIDDRFTGVKSRYVWASKFSQGRHSGPLESDGILRVDLEKNNSFTVTFPDERLGGEVRFCPMSKTCEEGKGYLLVHCHCPVSFSSEVLIYDALFEQGAKPIAIIRMPCRVVNGFHTYWVDRETYNKASYTSKL